MTLEQLNEAIGKLQHDEFLRLLESMLDRAQAGKRAPIEAVLIGESVLQYRVENGASARTDSGSNRDRPDNRHGGETMTKVQINLPDNLVKQAEHAGLLSSERLEQWLREQLREYRVNQLFTAMDSMAEVSEPAVMSPEEVARELAGMRADSRSARKS